MKKADMSSGVQTALAEAPIDYDPTKGSSSTAPVFVLPGVTGEQKLARVLATIPGLAPISYPTAAQLITEQLNFDYLYSHIKRQIEEKAPSGPFSLVGYSIGGPLAFACAADFSAAGRQVDCLVIVDAPAMMLPAGKPVRKQISLRVKNFFTFRVRAGLASALARALVTDALSPMLPAVAAIPPVRMPFNFGPFFEDKLRVHLLIRLFLPWWKKISAERYLTAVPTCLLRSDESDASQGEDFGWSAYCKELEVMSIPGSHGSILDPPNVSSLVTILTSVIEASRVS